MRGPPDYYRYIIFFITCRHLGAGFLSFIPHFAVEHLHQNGAPESAPFLYLLLFSHTVLADMQLHYIPQLGCDKDR